MLDQSNELAAWDRDHFFHPSTHMGTHARGEIADPHHGRRRRRHRLGQQRQEEHRCLRRPLLRQCRLWPPEDRRCHRRPGEEPRLLPRLCRPRHRGLDHACQDDHRPRAEGHVAGLFRPLRFGRQRDQHQADLVLQQRARPAGEEEDHLALARLSRLRRDDRLADRPRPVPQRLRPAARADPAHRGALLFPPRRPLDERGAVLAASAPTSSRR